MIRAALAAATLALAVLPAGVRAEAPPDAPAAAQAALPRWRHTSVNDFAGLLTPADTQALDEALIALNRQTGVEGTVVTLSDRARYGGTDGLEPFATRLFNHWGVGDATRNDGFMVLVVSGDREARIELGRGYAGGADIMAQDILNRVMLPAFRAGDFSGGLRAGALGVIDRIARPHAAGQSAGQSAPDRGGGSPATGLAIFAAASVGMFGLAHWRRRRRNRCPQCGHQGLDRAATPLREDQPGGGWRTAQQSVTRRCPACGWEDTRVAPLPVTTWYQPDGRVARRERRTDRTGGSSGFGGGSSSGGGASGRW